jgi:hypothetical protein
MITVERKVDFSRARRGRKRINGRRDRSKQMQKGADAPAISTGRVPPVSRLMALAIRFDQLRRDGVVTDQAELARLGHVTRARLTQIMNLLLLAPNLQEEILFLPATECGRHAITEKQLRPIMSIANWRGQSQLWRKLLPS